MALDAFIAARPLDRERYRDRAGVLEREVDALALLAAGRTNEGTAALREAAAAEAAMAIEFGPPFIDKPADELLGDVLLALGRGKEAIEAYDVALKRAPNRALSVAGLARAKSLP
jgi:predicted negative regulator of RcsB-dependent stress response